MPVLLHRLPEFLVPAAIPNSPSLLPVFEVDVWDGQSYAVTELPLAAVAATHPDSAALGALRGLVALHAAGQVHGGLNTGQLWQIGREVRLAGAGLPWQPEAGTGSDMQAEDMEALARALDTLGVRPAGIASLETMTAAQALEALETALAEQDRRRGATPDAPSFSPPVPVVPVAVLPSTELPVAVQPTPQAAVPELSAPKATPAFVPAIPAPGPVPLSPGKPAPEAPAAPPRYRSADDVIVIGKAGPALEAEPLEAAAPETSPPQEGRTPIRIGFSEPPALLPDWTPSGQPGNDGLEQPDIQVRQAGPEAENPQPEARRTPEEPALDRSEQLAEAVLPVSASAVLTKTRSPTRAPTIVPARPPGTEAPTSAGNPAQATRSQPLRIGWEEDHSWRVVKSGPERRRVSAPQLSSSTPRLALLAVVLLVGAGFWYWYFGQAGVPNTGCCTQSFTVRGSGGPVQVTLVQAPPGSPLQPGALIGTAPGTLKFQGVPGSYTLKFSAAGHRAVNGAVRVPSKQPFSIVLK